MNKPTRTSVRLKAHQLPSYVLRLQKPLSTSASKSQLRDCQTSNKRASQLLEMTKSSFKLGTKSTKNKSWDSLKLLFKGNKLECISIQTLKCLHKTSTIMLLSLATVTSKLGQTPNRWQLSGMIENSLIQF